MRIARRFINLLIFAAAWEILVFLGVGRLPHLHEIAIGYLDWAVVVEVFISLARTLAYVLISLLLGGSLGYAVGILMGLFPHVRRHTYDFFNGLKAIPITIMLPLLISIFRLDGFAIPAICIPIFSIIAVNVAEACDEVNSNRKALTSLLQIDGFTYWNRILKWETLNTVFASMRIVITYALALQIAFEYFLQHIDGIGKYIRVVYNGSRPNLYGEAYGAIILVAVTGITSIKILDLLSRNLLRWKTQI